MGKPEFIEGGLVVDDRGEVGFVNECDLQGVRRFYTVNNHSRGFVRAWHGHKKESKYLTVVQGAMLVCVVKPDNWKSPSRDLPIERFVLSEHKPAILYIPEGHAHGTMSLTEDAKLLVFSTAALEESLSDDYRLPFDYWDPWEVKQR